MFRPVRRIHLSFIAAGCSLGAAPLNRGMGRERGLVCTVFLYPVFQVDVKEAGIRAAEAEG